MCALSAINWNQKWNSVDSTRLPPMWAGFDPRTWRRMWVEFIVVSRLSSMRFYFSVPRFSPLLKNQNFQIKIRSGILGPRICQLQHTVKVSCVLNRKQRGRYAFGISISSFTSQCFLFYCNLVLARPYFTF